MVEFKDFKRVSFLSVVFKKEDKVLVVFVEGFDMVKVVFELVVFKEGFIVERALEFEFFKVEER